MARQRHKGKKNGRKTAVATAENSRKANKTLENVAKLPG